MIDYKYLLEDSSLLLLEDDFSYLLELVDYDTDKEILYKIYDSSGTFITTWTDVITEFSVKTTINSGLSPLTIRLARSEHEFGELSDVKQGNILKVYIFDKQSGVYGICVYSGILASYIPTVKGGQEYIDVEFFSQFWDLSNKILESSGNTEIAYNSYDPSNILKAVLDIYSALPKSVIDYTTASVELTGTVVSYTFNTNTYRECLERVIELCPDGWYYRLEADDLIYLKAKETDTSHYFTIGKDILEYIPEKRFDNIVNTIYFRGDGTLYKKYTNSSSVSTYGTRAVKMIDQRVSVAGTAQIMANRILNEKGSPEIRVTIKVFDNNGSNEDIGYDIESIKVGETCKILNATSKGNNIWDEILWDVDAWDYDITNASAIQLQIMSIEYHLDYAILELSNRQPEISKRIEDINRNLTNTQTADNPTAPT